MSNIPVVPHNPLVERRNAAAEALNHRRRAATEFAAKLADDRCAFFDKLAVLAAGALTFSVTLIGHVSQPHPQRLFILYAAWLSLLIALGACLVRNYSNQSHRFYSVGTNRAKSEIEFFEADSDAVKHLSGKIAYADAPEPFDEDREAKINKENREVWQRELERIKKKAEFHWKLSETAEVLACVSMLVGFFLLIAFAMLTT